MQTFKQKDLLQKYLTSFDNKNKTIGFVPTMGALHQGHLSLVTNSKNENDITVVSIFVNPTQFDNKQDLETYPNTLNEDLILLKKINCDVVFIPDSFEMYGNSLVSEHFDFGGIENEMEGAFRKGHFNGVGTIVKRLFEIVKPNKAYFGEKDFQQLQIIKKLVETEHLSVSIIGCPIHRETNGLAMSSRNKRLSIDQRNEAGFIFNILSEVKKSYDSSSIEHQLVWVKEQFKNHPSLELEYFTIADEITLKPIRQKKQGQKARAFVAAFLNSVRLIDNMALSQ